VKAYLLFLDARSSMRPEVYYMFWTVELGLIIIIIDVLALSCAYDLIGD